MIKTLLFFTIFCVIGIACGSLYGHGSSVIQLNKANFASQVFGSEHLWLVEFYAPWCGHCKSLAPEWEKAAKNLEGIVRIAAVNCDEEQNKELAGVYQIKGFPTIKLFGQLKPNPQKKGTVIKEPEDYNGARQAEAIVQFALSRLTSFVRPVTDTTFEKLMDSDKLPKAMLFTNKDKTTSLYKALSIDFKDRMTLLEVQHTQKTLVEKFKVSKFPTLVVLATQDSEPVIYDGALKHQDLFKFLSQFAPTTSKGTSQQQEKDSSKSVEVQPLVELKSQNDFEQYCTTKPGLCVIVALDVDVPKEEHQRHISLLEKLHGKFKNLLRIMWINGPTQQQFCDHLQLRSGFPGTVALSPKKKVYVPYVGAFDESQLEEFLNSMLRGKKRSAQLDTLPTLVDSNQKSEKAQGKQEL